MLFSVCLFFAKATTFCLQSQLFTVVWSHIIIKFDFLEHFFTRLSTAICRLELLAWTLVCVRGWVGVDVYASPCVRVCAHVRVCVRVCACVRAFVRLGLLWECKLITGWACCGNGSEIEQ